MNAELENHDKKFNIDEHSIKIEITETGTLKLSETVSENVIEFIPRTKINTKTLVIKENDIENQQDTQETSNNSIKLFTEEYKYEQVNSGKNDKSMVPCPIRKVLTEEDSKPEVFVNRPLCADYRSGSDSNSDSDSDSSIETSLSYDSESESSSSDDSRSNSEKKSCRIKKNNKDCGDLSLCDLPPIENLSITVPISECQEMGTILNIVGTLVVVQANKSSPALDIDTVLFLDKGQKSLGKIFDVLGPISEPVYTVRFNSKDEITKNGITPNMRVYCAPKTKYTSFVFVSELMKMRGSDASWKNNEEAPSEYQDFSDDEEEQKFKKGKNDSERNEQPSSSSPSSSSVDSSRKKVKIYHHMLTPKDNYRAPTPPTPPRPPVFNNPIRPPVNPINPFCLNPQFTPFAPYLRNPFFNPVEAPQPNPAFRCHPPMYGLPFRPPLAPIQPQTFPSYPQFTQRFMYPQLMWPPPTLPALPPPPPPVENIPPRPSFPMVYGGNIINQPK